MRNEEMLYEQEIRIGDILKQVIYRWKKALLVATIGAIVLAGYVVLSTINQGPTLMMSDSEIAEAEVRIKEIEDLIIANEDAIEVCEDKIAELERSIESNKTEIGVREDEIERVQLSIEKTKDLEEIYQTMVDNMMAMNTVEKDLNSEIMNATVKVADAQAAVYEKESRIVTLNREIRDLENRNEVTIPKEIEGVQDRVMELEGDIEVVREEMSELEKQMKKTITSEFNIVKVAIFAVLGFVLGLIVSGGYVTVKMMYDNRIHNTQVFEDGYGLFLLGSVSYDKKTDIFGKRLNKLIGVDKNVCVAEDKEVIISKIKTFSKTNKVMVIGTIEEEKIRAVVEKLKESMSSKELEFVSASNPMYSSESLNQIKNYELILVEKIDETKIKEMSKLIRFLDKSGASVLGVILA